MRVVDFERGLVTLVDPKGKKTTTVPVCREALEVLSALYRSSEFVFPGRDGKQRNTFKGPWLRIRKAAGSTLSRRSVLSMAYPWLMWSSRL